MQFERTSAGLRDALMAEMEDIRAGVATPAEAQAFALLARTVIASLEADISESLRLDAKEEREAKRRDREIERLRQDKILALEYHGADDDA